MSSKDYQRIKSSFNSLSDQKATHNPEITSEETRINVGERLVTQALIMVKEKCKEEGEKEIEAKLGENYRDYLELKPPVKEEVKEKPK